MLSVGAVAAFDTSNFFTSQGNLKNAAIVFGGDSYNTFPADASQLGVCYPSLIRPTLRRVVGDCITRQGLQRPVRYSDYFYGGRTFTAAAVPIPIFHQAISPLQFPSGPLFSDADAQLLNSTFVPVTQQIILSKLDNLQAGQAFFESVNNAPLFRTSFCHWVGTLAQENIAFLDSLIVSSPVRIRS